MNKLFQTAKRLFQTVKSQPLKFFFLAVWVGGLLLLYKISEDLDSIEANVKQLKHELVPRHRHKSWLDE